MFVDPKLYDAAPEEARDETEMRCYALLDSLKISYLRADHDEADTIEACHEVEKVLGAAICKNLFLTNRQQTDFYLLLMPGEKPFRTKLLSHQIGSARLSFAGPEHMEELLGLRPGSVSLLGLMNDREGRVRLLIDRDLLAEEDFCCHPCRNSSTLRMKTADVRNILIPALGHEPRIVDFPWDPDKA